MATHRLLIRSARQVVTVVQNGKKFLVGKDMQKVACMEAKDEQGISIVVDREGTIEAIGFDEEIKKSYNESLFERVINATGKSVIPGLVDGHTHTVWYGDRVHEFALKLAGASYMEVHKAGGGIMFTVDQIDKTSEDDLYKQFKMYVNRMSQAGTTLMECKSGYGLTKDNEIKMLKVIERARYDPDIAMDISSTYCGAHAIPKGVSAEKYTEEIINEHIPALQDLMQKGDLHVDNIDVFCEKGVFDVKQTKNILEAGQKIGLAINFHGEELTRLNSAEMGAALGARAISHLEEISDEGIEAMAASNTVAVVLPTTAYILRLQPPPVRKMIEAGVPVALGSDFNPNAHCYAMPTVLHLACVVLHMSMDEALVAATINAAASVGKSKTHGSLEVGKQGDMIILEAPRWEHLIYQLGSHHHIISKVIKKGKVVHEKETK